MRVWQLLQLVLVALCVALPGCAGQPELGRGGSMVTGSAGEAGAQAASAQLVRCDRPLGTAALIEPDSYVITSLSQLGLSSPIPVLRLLMAQSNCFQVVDRGAALGALETEQQLKASGMLQAGSTTAHGRMLTTQYLITPNVVFSNPDAGGYGAAGALGALLPGPAGVVTGALGDIRIKEAQTLLFLTDAQTGVQTAAAEGSARVKDFGGVGGLGGFVGSVAGLSGVSGYGNTDEGKLVVAALLDAHNKLVTQVRATQPNLPPVTGEDSSAAPNFVPGGYYTPVVMLKVRGAAGTNAAVVGLAGPGVILVVTGERRGDWWRVQGPGFDGWVSSRYLRYSP